MEFSFLILSKRSITSAGKIETNPLYAKKVDSGDNKGLCSVDLGFHNVIFRYYSVLFSEIFRFCRRGFRIFLVNFY